MMASEPPVITRKNGAKAKDAKAKAKEAARSSRVAELHEQAVPDPQE